jgi:hypothetical protein
MLNKHVMLNKPDEGFLFQKRRVVTIGKWIDWFLPAH